MLARYEVLDSITVNRVGCVRLSYYKILNHVCKNHRKQLKCKTTPRLNQLFCINAVKRRVTSEPVFCNSEIQCWLSIFYKPAGLPPVRFLRIKIPSYFVSDSH